MEKDKSATMVPDADKVMSDAHTKTMENWSFVLSAQPPPTSFGMPASHLANKLDQTF